MTETRGPKIKVPPAFFVGGFLVGVLLESAIRIPFVTGASVRTLSSIGWLIALLGFALSLSGILAFRRAHTTMFPFEAATRVVQNGPYRFTRNPMYLGATVTYIGIALAMNVGWPLILLPLVLWGLYRWVIRVEEQYLTNLFGEEYVTYTKRVRRWI